MALVIFASIFANVSSAVDLKKLYQPTLYATKSCQKSVNSILTFMGNLSSSSLYPARAATLYNFDQKDSSMPATMSILPVLNPADTAFDFFPLVFIYDWIIGNSEVVSFQGDNGNLTLLGNNLADYKQLVDLSLLPTRGVQYATFVMIALASITFIYVITSHGYVEGQNMFELIWVGRPLVLLRSLTSGYHKMESTTFRVYNSLGIRPV
ncbi:hypothetical protein THRCLA_02914 [Thraustotheca clavata]|uniref:Secreted protein n=1 Tax=Thraustotheca clavata TaxID=74557 RepID=A0A1W0A3M2_9STRA|nr:hypothetical protein THRCLA_02914 [Thraustotheca clavata]